MSKQAIKIKLYDLIERAVQDGIASGWHRAHKHTDNPTEHEIKKQIERGIMGELSDYIDFSPDAESSF